jgi:GTP-binding protein EngB required for normal cell division
MESGSVAGPRNWAGIGAYLERDNVRLLADAKRSALLSDWRDISQQEANLDDAILIGLVGGTGVGKSTFINAFAGEAVSRSSDRRPTTDRVIVYRHVNTEVAASVPSEDFSQPQVMHDNDRLEKVILFDFPDFDSAEDSHAGIIRRYLPFLDVLLVVVDDVKYADRRLYELLRTLDHAQDNIFVLVNKVDRLAERYGAETSRVVAELIDDLHDKLKLHGGLDLKPEQKFPIAALPVYQARIRGEDASAIEPFSKVERLLEGFQEAKHRRAAKELNIDARKRTLTGALGSSALGPDNQAILTETNALVHGWRGELDTALQCIPVEILSEAERRGARRNRLRQIGPAWGLPFSLFFTLLGELRRRNVKAVEPTEFGHRAVQHYRGFFEAIKNLQARYASEFSGSKIKLSPTDSRSVELTRTSSADLTRIMQARLQSDNIIKPGSRKWMAHIPGLGVLVLAIWGKIYPILESTTNDSSTVMSLVWSVFTALDPTFLIGVIAGVLLVYALTALVIWLREIQALDADIGQVEKAARDAIRNAGQQVVNELDADVQSLHEEFQQLEAMIQS